MTSERPGAGPQHHLAMTRDPVAGFVQLPCIERCAFGAIKSWMNSKYTQTSEGGLAVSVVLC